MVNDHDAIDFISNLNSGLFFVDQNEILIFINDYLADLLNISLDEFIGGSYKFLFSKIISNSTEPAVIQRLLDHSLETLGNKPEVHFSMELKKKRYFKLSLLSIEEQSRKTFRWGGLLNETTFLQEEVIWKGKILSGVVRDIRSELATLKGLASALEENFTHWSDEMVSEFLAETNKKIDSLSLVVDQTLMFSQMRVGDLGLNPAEVSVSDLIDASLEKISSLVDSASVVKEIPNDLPQIRVDTSRVEDIFAYFLQSSIDKASGEESLRIIADADERNVYIRFQLPYDEVSIDWTLKDDYTDGDGETDSGRPGRAYQYIKKIIEAQGGGIKLETLGERGVDYGIVFSFPILPDVIPSETADEKNITPGRTGGHILIVEKEPDFQAIFSTLIGDAGYNFDLCASGKTAVNILDSTSVDLILISETLEDMHGMNLLQTLRRYSNVPIVFVGYRADSDLMVDAFKLGADDFVSKPINSRELIARVHSHIHRKGQGVKIDSEADRFTINGLTIDLKTRQVWKSGNEIELTIKEFKLVEMLIKNQGRVLTYQNIIQTLWEPGKGSRHALSVHVSRLRQKIETNPQNPQLILTKWGVGYFIKQAEYI